MISVTRYITADNTDVLSGTDLAQIPDQGTLGLYIASTQADTVVTITGPGIEPAGRLITVQLRTNGQPNQSDDLGYLLPVVQGGKYVINVDVVTAATVGIIASFTSDLEQELA